MDTDFPSKDFYNFSFYRLAENQFASQGNQQAQTVVILPPFADEAERDFLTKILQAVNIPSLETVLLVELPLHTPFSWAAFASQHQVKNWLVFARTGISMGWQFDIPFYTLQFIAPQHQFLLCESLAIIKADTNKKRKLWESLKQMFN